MYINGSLDQQGTATGTQGTTQTNNITIGTWGDLTNDFEGEIDELSVWDRELNSTEVLQLWNGGAGLQYTYGLVGTFDITSKDFYNSSSILNFTVEVDGIGNFSTTNGTVKTNITSNSTSLIVNLTVWNATNYFNVSVLNRNVSTDIVMNVTPYTLILANDLQSTNIQNFTITYLNTVDSSDTGFQSTTSGRVYIPLFNSTYNVTLVNASNSTHTFSNADTLVNANPYLQNYTFTLFPDPSSISISIYNADNNSLIDEETITLVVTGTTTENTFTTTNGTIFIGNLTADIYNIKISGVSYNQTAYIVTVGTNTHQNLNAYLSLSTGIVTFTTVDRETNAQIESVLVVMSRFVNGSSVTVESEFSDITGRVQFNFLSSVNYCFVVTHPNYVTRSFCLDPIKFTDYDIRLESTVILNDTSDYSTVNVFFEPDRYFENEQNNFTIRFISPTGSFTSYSVNVSYPGGLATRTGSNANGEDFNIVFNIGATNFGDLVNVTYSYQTTTSGYKFFRFPYRVIQDANAGTMMGNRNQTFGLGDFERAVIGTGGIILFAGAGTFFGGAMVGGAFAMFLMSYYVYIGFWHVWAVIISMLVGFVAIVWGSSR